MLLAKAETVISPKETNTILHHYAAKVYDEGTLDILNIVKKAVSVIMDAV